MNKLQKNWKLSATGLAMAMLFYACQQENNGGNGPSSTDSRDKYVGTWHCSENSQVYGNTAYDVNMLKSGNDSLMVIENFYGLNFSNKVTVSLHANGVNFTIPAQTVSGHAISGSGLATNATTIQWNYTVNDGSVDDVVTSTYSKQ